MARRVNINALRTSMGISIDEFAKRIGVHPRSVSRWENAHADPSPLALSRIKELQQPELPKRRPYTPQQQQQSMLQEESSDANQELE